MKNVNKYNEYCVLVSKLDSKTMELRKVTTQRNRVVYEVESLKKELQEYKDISDMKPKDISSIKRLRMRSCLNTTVYFEDGGGLDGIPIIEFKKSEYYKKLTSEQKKLFKKVEDSLSENQYSLQNAVLIGQTDEEDFDVYKSSVIEDYVDESMSGISDYNDISTKKLKELKQIMYKFVEQVSKM
tara:strand:+ start:70 stop:621 length:552 start_codon:yes stop_codon:yes gene_type:complete